MEINNLFMKLTDPVKVCLCNDLIIEESLFIDKMPVNSDYSLWMTLPNILVNKKKNQWIGLSYIVPDKFIDYVKKLIQSFDKDVVYLKRLDLIQQSPVIRNIEEYPEDGNWYLHIKWAQEEENLVYGMQEWIEWFYPLVEKNKSDEEKNYFAIGVNDIDLFCEDYDLNFPEQLPYPELDVEAI